MKKRKRVVVKCGPSLTKQCFRDECDINNILRRYQKTGQLPSLIAGNPVYGDFSEIGDYQTALDVVARAQIQFASLPAVVRDRFAHSPEQFLEFVNDPANIEELKKMGLTKEPQASAEGSKQELGTSPAKEK